MNNGALWWAGCVVNLFFMCFSGAFGLDGDGGNVVGRPVEPGTGGSSTGWLPPDPGPELCDSKFTICRTG